MKFLESLEKKTMPLRRTFFALSLVAGITGCQWFLPPIIEPNGGGEETPVTTTTSTTTTTTIPGTTTTTVPGTTTTTIPTPPTTTTTTIPVPVEENYLISRFDLGNYVVGSSFDRLWTIQNISDKNVTFDNSPEHSSLSYNVLRKRDGFPEENLYGFIFKELLKVEFWPLGYIQIQTNAHTTKFTATNCSVFYQGKIFEIPYPLKFSKTEDLENLVIDSPGDYWVKAMMKYKVSGEDTEYQGDFTSPIAEVK